MIRRNISSGARFEDADGFSRAVQVGQTLYVSGTLGFDHATAVCPEAPADQTRQAIRNI